MAERALVHSSSYKGTNLIHRGPILMTLSKSNYLSRALPPNTITSGIRVSTYGIWAWDRGRGHKCLVHSGPLYLQEMKDQKLNISTPSPWAIIPSHHFFMSTDTYLHPEFLGLQSIGSAVCYECVHGLQRTRQKAVISGRDKRKRRHNGMAQSADLQGLLWNTEPWADPRKTVTLTMPL